MGEYKTPTNLKDLTKALIGQQEIDQTQTPSKLKTTSPIGTQFCPLGGQCIKGSLS